MISRNSIKTVAIHLGLWLGYVLLEYLANIYHIRPETRDDFLVSVLFTLPAIMVPTYFILLVVIPRFIKPGKIVATLLSFVLVALYVVAARIFWFEQISHFEFSSFSEVPMGKIFKNIIRDYSVIALASCIVILTDWREKQRQNEQLIKMQAQQELEMLKGQLQPHFLFNTLNNIYSLALVNSDQTADSILKLTSLLEYLVYWAGKTSVPLQKELGLIDDYIELETLRHGDALAITRNMNIGSTDIMLPPLIMLPFFENCFKHGGPAVNGTFSIDFSLQIENGNLLMQLVNTKKQLRNGGDLPGGVGLSNIRARLARLYPERFDLQVKNAADSYVVILSIKSVDEF